MIRIASSTRESRVNDLILYIKQGRTPVAVFTCFLALRNVVARDEYVRSRFGFSMGLLSDGGDKIISPSLKDVGGKLVGTRGTRF